VRTKPKHEEDADGQNVRDRNAESNLRPALLPLSADLLKPRSNGTCDPYLFGAEDLNL